MQINYFLKRIFILFIIATVSFGLKAQTVVNGVAYRLIDGSNPAVAEVVALPNSEKYTGELNIQANVEIEGTTYQVKKIGDGSLRDASALTAVNIPEGIEIIGNSAFASCTGITEIVLPSSVKSIEDWAFYGCSNMASINIPEGITAINEHTFQESGLTSITLPSSVTEVKTCAFQSASKLASVNLENVTSIGGYALYGTAITTANMPKVTTVGGEAFRECPNLETVIFSELETLLGWTFTDCPKLESVDLGTKLGKIDTGTFSGCTALTSIVIPSSVTNINAWSLEKTSITEIFVSWSNPNDVNIEGNAFGAGEGKIDFTWKVPESVSDNYGETFENYPVVKDFGTGMENAGAEKIEIYYTNGNLYVNNLAGYSISVFSLDGRVVENCFVKEANSITSVSLNTGIYLIKAEKGGKTTATKIAVN